MRGFVVQWTKLLTIVALVSLPIEIVSCAAKPSNSDQGNTERKIFTPTELNANADEYNGKDVYVRGWVVIGYEQFHIWDSKDAQDRPWPGDGKEPNSCISYLGDIKDRTSGRMEILHGTFWKDFAIALNVYALGTCNWSGLDVESAEVGR